MRLGWSSVRAAGYNSALACSPDTTVGLKLVAVRLVYCPGSRLKQCYSLQPGHYCRLEVRFG